MPYISRRERLEIDASPHLIQTVGQLNYHISMLLRAYVDKHGLCYGSINDVVGVLESAKAEFQRRVVAPYEDKKIQENGDL